MEWGDYAAVASDRAAGAVWGRGAGRRCWAGRGWGMYRLLGGKLTVTALRVHHFSPRTNYSRFHLATLLCPPQCTMVVTYNRTDSQGPRVKDGEKWLLGCSVSKLFWFLSTSWTHTQLSPTKYIFSKTHVFIKLNNYGRRKKKKSTPLNSNCPIIAQQVRQAVPPHDKVVCNGASRARSHQMVYE